LICTPAVKIKHARAEGEQAKDMYPDIIRRLESENAKDDVWNE
jgi:hypothetical protein